MVGLRSWGHQLEKGWWHPGSRVHRTESCHVSAPHPHPPRTELWTQSGTRVRTFLDADCGLMSGGPTQQEWLKTQGATSGARGHRGSGRLSDLPGVAQQSQV